MICAVSYRMVAAFVLPEQVLPEPARLQVLSLSGLVPVLAGAILLRSWLVTPLALLTAGSLVWYASIILRLLHTRRMAIDWSMRHVQAALAHLGAAAVCGLAFSLGGVDVGSRLGARLAVAYGVFGLFGWVSNFILGMATRLAPGLAAAPGLPPSPLVTARTQAVIFSCFNLGVPGIAAGTLADAPRLLSASIVLTLCATLLFARAMLGRARRMLTYGQGPQ